MLVLRKTSVSLLSVYFHFSLYGFQHSVWDGAMRLVFTLSAAAVPDHSYAVTDKIRGG
jgi:hypothetical protein